ncbi:uncharacterized protein LOC62_04G005250 [Vanrija pseudolonga]|uniref:F-box domain-containing protein n=1 Tax=Vanrija pseudolonga TaxID=143232 RepID=A0AAF0YDC5_9TREE|nr:hypothetical protein LOC62_04G005250 [Vanrija pseudolonga]
MPDEPATLDASAYPHIVDLVLAHTPLADLIPLRLVSREFRDRVDATIDGYHVQLIDHRWRCVSRCSPPYAVVPAHVPWTNKSSRPEHCLQTLPTSLPRTLIKVVQLSGAGASQTLVDAVNSIGTVHTLQRSGPSGMMGNFPPSGWDRRLRTVVDFLDLRSFQSSTGVYTRRGGWEHFIVMPDPTRRYVLHVTFDQLRPDSDSAAGAGLSSVRTIRVPTADVRDFVLVLWPTLGTDAAQARRGPYKSFPHILHSLILAMGRIARSGGTATIVGADRLSPLLLGEPQLTTSNRSGVLEAVKAAYRAWAQSNAGREWLTPEQLDQVDERTRWLTIEEWWAELGVRRQYEGLAVGTEKVSEQEGFTTSLLLSSGYGLDGEEQSRTM